MRLVEKIKGLVGQWPDPYQYECPVCERSFQSERSTCPDCGGEVARAGERESQVTADSHP